MSGCKKPARSDKPSIKYRRNPVKGAPFELHFGQQKYAPTLSGTDKKSSEKAEPKSPEILSTVELISAVSQTWDCVNRLAVFQPKANSNLKDKGCQRKDILGNLGGEENGNLNPTTDDKYFYVDVRTEGHNSSMVQPNLEFLYVTEKISLFKPCRERYNHSLLWRFLLGGTNLPDESWKGKGLTSLGISYELGNIYGWMNDISPAKLKYHVKDTEIKNTENDENSVSEDTVGPLKGCNSEDTTLPASVPPNGSDDCYSDLIRHKDISSCSNAIYATNTSPTTSMCSDYFLRVVQNSKSDITVSRTPSSNLSADDHLKNIASCNSAFEESQHEMGCNNELLENKKKVPEKNFCEDETTRLEVCSSAPRKPHQALAKQEHAFAGALAGIFVSLCLHPVDTVKTVIQSCRAEQKSISYIGRSIVTERGVTGFYRGITSNITSSAPISAVYTFTYESVKGALLPLFPKEYYSFAHCIAGGCASIATSFIFTPSERIKQQMQVGSHYPNCWRALVGVIGKGGLPSLYTGWGAVLCRNVPHSIIKFYTYESLKRMMLSSQKSSDQLNTLQTLCCGGVAGSTAALFTTPFDVVKTRLQTQIPGSVSQYGSVFHALQEISKHEGLNGLYRGLLPRLVMYMSQGALFFASYEFCKRVFCLDVPQFNAQQIQHKEDRKDYPTPSPLASQSLMSTASPESPSPPLRLHSFPS